MLDAPVELALLVVAAAGEEDKVVTGHGGEVAVELEVDVAEVGGETDIALLLDLRVHNVVHVPQLELVLGRDVHRGRRERRSHASR